MNSPDGDASLARLHPLTPLLKGVRNFWFIIAAISWQGFAQLGVQRGAMVVAGFGVLGLIWSWIGWYVTGYRVAGGELRIVDGVLTRSRRAIPLARLQAVEVVRPLLARLVGLAELRLEVAGGTKTEAPLSYLPLGQAQRLRRRLLDLSTAGAAPETDAEESAAEEPEDEAVPLVSVPTDRLIGAQLLTPQILGLPVALAGTVGLFAIDPDLSLFGVFGVITAVAGIVLQPVREALVNHRFTAYVTGDGLRLRHGLIEQRHQTLPLRRVVGVAIRRPLLWRKVGWVRAEVASAAYGSNQGGERMTGRTLLPVGTPEEAYRLIAEVLPGVDVEGLAFRPVPDRAKWRVPLSRKVLGLAVADEVVAVRTGLLTTTVTVLPYERIQSVRVVQGRWQRLLGLATVRVDLAGITRLPAAAKHRDVTEALALALDLVRRARGRH